MKVANSDVRVTILLWQEPRSYRVRNLTHFTVILEMSYEPDEILAEFRVLLQRLELMLPRADINPEPIEILKQTIQRRLPYIGLTSEAARRETLIAPIFLSLIDYT